MPHPPGVRNFIDRLTGHHYLLHQAIITGALLVVGYPVWWAFPEHWTGQVGHVLIWVSLGIGGIHGLRGAFESLQKLKPDIDVLMVLGAGLAAAIGHPEEGALLLFLFALAHGLEHRAMARTKDAVARLNRLMPTTAQRRSGDGWDTVDVEHLAASDEVLIRPGDTIPADCVILTGVSTIDQATLTGESLPREVREGCEVFAGTINQSGSLEARIMRPISESSLEKILTLVLEAQENRQPLQRVIDRFSTPYTITVFIAALAVLFGFGALTEITWADAAYRAITLIVVASPCALIIATPTATLCGLSRMARAGVLVKGGDALERLAKITQVVLDKTGTLTRGRIEVVHVHPIGASCTDCLLSLALAAEQHSSHPIAPAIIRYADEHKLIPAKLEAIDHVFGQGIEGHFAGSPCRIGTLEYCTPLIPVCFQEHTRRIVESVRTDGVMPVVITHDDSALVLALADEPRPGARHLLVQLKQAGVHEVAMLTGDHAATAQRIADDLGIDTVRSQLLPEDKVAEIESLRAASPHGALAVIGDGVNDAPAMAVADVGLAMGSVGADAALETADVILLHDDLDRVPWSFMLAQRIQKIMMANLIFATFIIALLGACAAMGKIPLYLGVIGHEGSTLLVVANSLRLLAHRDPAASYKP